MDRNQKKLCNNLFIASKCVLGTGRSSPSPADLQRIYDAVVAIETECVTDGEFRWKNAKAAK